MPFNLSIPLGCDSLKLPQRTKKSVKNADLVILPNYLSARIDSVNSGSMHIAEVASVAPIEFVTPTFIEYDEHALRLGAPASLQTPPSTEICLRRAYVVSYERRAFLKGTFFFWF